MVKVGELSWDVILGIVALSLIALCCLSLCLLACYRWQTKKKTAKYKVLASDEEQDVGENCVKASKGSKHAHSSKSTPLIDVTSDDFELTKDFHFSHESHRPIANKKKSADSLEAATVTGNTTLTAFPDIESSVKESHASGEISLSAYGDSVSTNDSDGQGLSPASFLPSANAHIQISLYASAKKGIVAGNVISVDDIPPRVGGGPDRVKVHIAILPRKRYALKTRWHDVEPSHTKIDEHFRYKLSASSTSLDQNLRVRVYGARKRKGIAAHQKCLGQFVVSISDVEAVKGGITFYERLQTSPDGEGMESLSASATSIAREPEEAE